MNAWNPTIVLMGQHASTFLEAITVYARKDMKETGKVMEQDAVQNPVPNKGKRLY